MKTCKRPIGIGAMIAACVFSSACVCYIAWRYHAVDAKAGAAATNVDGTAKGDNASVVHWPFFAWHEVNMDADKVIAKGVLPSECASAIHTCHSPDDILDLTVPTNDGKRVCLREVATVDIALIRRGGQLAYQELQRRKDAYGVNERSLAARLVVDVEERLAAKVGVDAESVRQMINHLSQDRQYTLEGIRNLAISSRNGDSIRLSQVAKIDVVWENGGREGARNRY